jgi:hypothetical protein
MSLLGEPLLNRKGQHSNQAIPQEMLSSKWFGRALAQKLLDAGSEERILPYFNERNPT